MAKAHAFDSAAGVEFLALDMLQTFKIERSATSAGDNMTDTLTVGVIDVGMGNIGAIKRSLESLRLVVKIIRSPTEFMCVDGIVLPGVGSYDRGVEALHRHQLWDELLTYAQKPEKSILGICLGLQLLCKSSEEGSMQGLAILDAQVLKLSSLAGYSSDYRIPNIGWNYVSAKTPLGAQFLEACGERQRYYFTHSYYVEPDNKDVTVLTSSDHSGLTAAVIDKNIWGYQFHPEKSHRFGESALKNWVNNLKCL